MSSGVVVSLIGGALLDAWTLGDALLTAIKAAFTGQEISCLIIVRASTS